MIYGKVNEHEIPMNPKAGWYFVQIDTGIKGCCNPHRKGTKLLSAMKLDGLREILLKKELLKQKQDFTKVLLLVNSTGLTAHYLPAMVVIRLKLSVQEECRNQFKKFFKKGNCYEKNRQPAS